MPSDWALYIATVIACEMALRLPLRASLATMLGTLRRVGHILASKRISDHWKETILPVYALRLFRASILFMALMVVLLVPFAGVGLVLAGGVGDLMAALSEWSVMAIMMAVACVYIWLRLRFGHG